MPATPVSITSSPNLHESPNFVRSSGQLIPSRVLGASIFVFVELMFFSALFSAYFVIKRGSNWDVPGPGHLPLISAGFNGLVLIASGISLYLARQAFVVRKDLAAFRGHALRSWALGLLFTVFQLYFGFKMIAEGLTMGTSIFGACYFLLVGAHWIHVLFGLGLMALSFRKVEGATDSSVVQGVLIFWTFVVAIWPFIYAEIYF